MSYANYVYTDNQGNAWSVGVPQDFASALGQTPASAQPYLDNTISPRYAVYRDPSQNVRTAVIDTQGNLTAIVGSTVVVGGVTFTCVSAFGEQRPPIQQSLLVLPQGPQGPPGGGGSGGVQLASGVLTPSQIINLNTTPIIAVPAPGPNQYICPIAGNGFLKFNTTPYSVSSSSGILYAFDYSFDGFWGWLIGQGPLSASNDSCDGYDVPDAVSNFDPSTIYGLPLQLLAESAAVTTGGDSSFYWTIAYMLVGPP